MDRVSLLNRVYDVFSITLLGNKGVGKAEFVESLSFSNFDIEAFRVTSEYIRNIFTIDSNHFVKVRLDYRQDIHNGNLNFDRYKNADAFIMMFDISNRKTFDLLTHYYRRIRSFRECAPPTLLIGTKSDLEENRQVSTVEALYYAKKMGSIAYYETNSHIKNIGILHEILPQFILIRHLNDSAITPTPTSNKIMNKFDLLKINHQIENFNSNNNNNNCSKNNDNENNNVNIINKFSNDNSMDCFTMVFKRVFNNIIIRKYIFDHVKEIHRYLNLKVFKMDYYYYLFYYGKYEPLSKMFENGEELVISADNPAFLMFVRTCDDRELVRHVISNLSKYNYRDYSRLMAIRYDKISDQCCLYGDLESVQWLFYSYDSLPTATGFRYAVMMGHLHILSFILDHIFDQVTTFWEHKEYERLVVYAKNYSRFDIKGYLQHWGRKNLKLTVKEKILSTISRSKKLRIKKRFVKEKNDFEKQYKRESNKYS